MTIRDKLPTRDQFNAAARQVGNFARNIGTLAGVSALLAGLTMPLWGPIAFGHRSQSDVFPSVMFTDKSAKVLPTHVIRTDNGTFMTMSVPADSSSPTPDALWAAAGKVLDSLASCMDGAGAIKRAKHRGVFTNPPDNSKR